MNVEIKDMSGKLHDFKDLVLSDRVRLKKIINKHGLGYRSKEEVRINGVPMKVRILVKADKKAITKTAGLTTTTLKTSTGQKFSSDSLPLVDRSKVASIAKAHGPGYRGDVELRVNGTLQKLKMSVDSNDRYHPAGTSLSPGRIVKTASAASVMFKGLKAAKKQAAKPVKKSFLTQEVSKGWIIPGGLAAIGLAAAAN